MSNMFNILLSIYLIIIAIHLYCCYQNIDNIRRFTTVFLMPLLAMLYHTGTLIKKYSKLVLSGIIFGFLGDLFLLANPYSPLVIIGLVTFLIGHVLYVISFIREAGFENYKKYFYVFIIISVIYFYGETVAFQYLKEGFIKRKVMIPGISYLSLLMILNITSGFYMFTYPNIYTFLSFLGSNSFFASDFILVRKMFYETNMYYQVALMTLYILAQSLICYGLAHRKDKTESKIKIN